MGGVSPPAAGADEVSVPHATATAAKTRAPAIARWRVEPLNRAPAAKICLVIFKIIIVFPSLRCVDRASCCPFCMYGAVAPNALQGLYTFAKMEETEPYSGNDYSYCPQSASSSRFEFAKTCTQPNLPITGTSNCEMVSIAAEPKSETAKASIIPIPSSMERGLSL